MINKLSLQDRLFLLLIIIISCLISFYYNINQIVSFDQVQMLSKGFFYLAENKIIPFGNEASTVGNVPGSISSLLIAIPLSISTSPYFLISYIIILRLIGAFFFINALGMLFSKKVVIFGAIIYLLNPWFLYDSLVYNPTFLSIGSAIYLCMLVRLSEFNKENTTKGLRFFYTLFLVLAIGFCAQLHFSWPVLVIICFILYIRGDIKVSYLGGIVGVILILLSLIDYFMYIQENSNILINHEPYSRERYFGWGLVHVYPLFKSVLYYLRFGSLLITSKALPIYEAVNNAFIFYISFISLYAIGIVTLIVSAIANYKLIFKDKNSNLEPRVKFIRSVSVATVLGTIISAAMATLVLNFWQIIIIFPLCLLAVIYFVSKHFKLDWHFYSLLIIFLICMNLVSASYSEKFNINYSFEQQYYQVCQEMYHVDKCQIDNTSVLDEQWSKRANIFKLNNK